MKLIPVAIICRFLGKSPRDAEHLIAAGLPVCRIPGAKKSTPRVIPSAFLRWAAERSGGETKPADIRADLEAFLATDAESKAEARAADLLPA